MTRSQLLRALVAAALFAPAIGRAGAAPVSARINADGEVALLHPLEIIRKRDLDFGYVARPAVAGSVTINPNTGAVTTTGGLMLLGGTRHSALFTGAAKSNSVVIVRIPKQPVTLTRFGGTDTMTVSNFTLEGLDKRQAAAKVSFDFAVGATLNVKANQPEGLYTGTFEVSIQYP